MAEVTTDKAEWIAARKALLDREKAHSRERDALAKARRELPALKIEKQYRFETATGQQSLLDLFDGKSQLMIYHFMFGPDWAEGCSSCSFWGDNLNGVDIHLAHRDVSLVFVSSAGFQTLDEYRKRMGWDFTWVGGAQEFNRDMNVSFNQEELDSGKARYNYSDQGFPSTEAPGLTAFRRIGDEVYQTYGTFGRGLDYFNGAYQLLDLAPDGRNESDLPWPMAWLRRRDQYDI